MRWGYNQVYVTLCVLVFGIFFHPHLAHAVPPPDVISSVGSQLSQFLGLGAVLFSLSVGMMARVFQQIALRTGMRSAVVFRIAILVIVLGFSSAYVFASYQSAMSQRAYNQQIADDLKRGFDDQFPGEDGVLVDGTATSVDPTVPEAPIDLSLFVSNDAFRTIESSHPFVLDAREDEEYAYGRYPGSTHIRFADLMNGEWSKVPTHQPVYVFCWSGIRGEMVTTFLRTKGIRAQYLEKGAEGWVKDGGTWEGEISFAVKYPEERYSKVITTAEAHAAVDSGALLIDARDAEAFSKKHIEGAINISAIFTPSSELADEVAAVPVGATVITVCDSFVSCFDAKIVALKLEAASHTFFGRYNTPWEY